MKQPFTRMWVEVKRTEDLGDGILALLMVHGVGKESGAEVEIQRAQLAQFEGTEMGVVQNYSTWAEALEAAGLSE